MDWEPEKTYSDENNEFDSFMAFPSEADLKLRLRDVISAFPLEVEGFNSAFHFRFQLKVPGARGYVWLDLNDLDATVPRLPDCIVCKVRLNEIDGVWLEEKQVDAVPDWDQNFGWEACKVEKKSQGRGRAQKARDPLDEAFEAQYGEEQEDLDTCNPQEVLESLRHEIQSRFEANSAAHRRLLENIWEPIFEAEPFPGNLRSVHWATIGFEDEDPCMELRSTACAVLALRCLGYFCEAYGQDVHRIIVSQTDPEGFSFVHCGFSINTMLIAILALDDVDRMRPEVMQLLSEPDFFQELFCLCFITADDRKAKSKTGKSLDVVLHELEQDLARIISNGAVNAMDIQKKLILAKEGTTATSVANAAREKWKAATTWAASDGKDQAAQAISKAKNMFGNMFSKKE